MTDIDVNLDNALVVEIEVPAVTPLVVDSEGIPGDPGEQGNDGWSAVLANVTDGDRIVHRVVNWIGGTGTPPAVGQYVGAAGFVDDIANAVNMRGRDGEQGAQGEPGTPGAVIIGEGVDILTGEGPPAEEIGATNQLYLDTITGDVYKKLDPEGWTVVANIRGPAGPKGDDGEQGEDGEQGLQGVAGWSPVLAMVNDGNRRVYQIADWTGGAGTKPGYIGQYISATGPTNIIANAIDARGPAGAPGTDGSNGLPGVTGTSLLVGTGAPSNGLGNNGDSYINLANGDMYGPKAAGAWGASSLNIKGPKGDQGDDGADGAQGFSILTGAGVPSGGLGANGDSYLNTTNGDVYGPKAAGVWGSPTGNIKGATGAKGDPGDPGEPGTNGTNGTNGADGADGEDGTSFLSGAGAPGSGVGEDGDTYLNTTNGDVYGPKTSGAWGSSTGNIRGPAGADGADGTNGADGEDGAPGEQGPPGSQIHAGAGAPSVGLGSNGDFYLNETNGDYYIKSAGAWGAPLGNLKGPKGDKGDKGDTGEAGADGADGANGADGADGTNGSKIFTGSGTPNDAAGEDGDYYFRTNGDVYGPKTGGAWGSVAFSIKGATGAKGDTGDAGADGSDGLDGATIRSGSGVPSGGTGNDGDYYLNTANGDWYGPKTSGAWGSVIVNLKGPKGDTGDAGEAGSNGADGADGADGAQGASVLVGTVLPGGGTGNDGDVYIRTTTGDIFGPKSGGLWGSPVGNLTGPAGADAGDPLKYFRANKTVAQNGVSVSTPVFINWDTEDDPQSQFDISTGRWTPTAGGPVMMVGSVQVAAASSTFNASTNITIGFRKNGSTIVGVVNTRVQAAIGVMNALGVFMDTPSPGDYYEMYVQTGAVSSGTTYNIQNNIGTFFTGVELTGSKGDAGEGVPTGGTTGQVLAKVNGTDYNTNWVDAIINGAVTFAKMATAAIATTAEICAGTASKIMTASGLWGAADPTVLTAQSGSITLDFNTSLNWIIETTGSITITPTNLKTGQAFGIYFKKGSSAHTVTLSNQSTGGAATWKPIGGSAPALTTANDYISGQRLGAIIAYSGGSV